MAIAAIPAAAWWALGSAAAGGIAAKQTGHDWRKGAALGALGGLGLSTLLGAGAAGAGAGAGGAGVGSAVGEAAELGAGAGAGGGLASIGAGTTASAVPSVGSTIFADAAKEGAINAGMAGLQSSMTPDVTSENPQPFALQNIPPETVFAIIRELQSRRAFA